MCAARVEDRDCPESIEGCPCLEHHMSCVEDTTNDIVSHGSVGQQRIREAVSKQPRGTVHTQLQWYFIVCFKVHMKSYLLVLVL